MTIDQAELLKWLVAIVGFIIAILLGLIGYLLKRAIQQLDEKLDLLIDGHADHEGRLVRVETHLGINVPQPARPPRVAHAARAAKE